MCIRITVVGVHIRPHRRSSWADTNTFVVSYCGQSKKINHKIKLDVLTTGRGDTRAVCCHCELRGQPCRNQASMWNKLSSGHANCWIEMHCKDQCVLRRPLSGILQTYLEQPHEESYTDVESGLFTLTCSPWISARWAFSASSSRRLSASSFWMNSTSLEEEIEKGWAGEQGNWS